MYTNIFFFLRVCSFTCSKHNSFIILAACARQLQKIKQGRNRGLGAVHKVRQDFLGSGEGSKIEEKLMMDRYKKVLTRGRGLSKIAKKVLTYFMDGPLAGRQLGKHN